MQLPATTGSPNFQTVTFRQAYSSPPVVVTMAPKGGSQDPTAIVIRNVTATGFEAVQVEAPGANGVGPSRTIHYLAMDAGAHELPDGTRILADTVSITDQQHGSGVTGTQSWHTETFAQWGSGGGSSPLPASQVMSYDANGNRSSINESGTLYSYNNQANSNRLLSTAGPSARTYSYDAVGNVIGDGTYSYGYDDRGRLVDVDNAISYRHNGLGQRVEKDDGTDTRLFVYDDAGNLIGEYDDNGVAIVEHVWFAGAPVAILEGSNAFYVHTDHLGTPRTITDGNNAIWRWQSDPFGSTMADEDPDGDGNPLEYNLRFPGQYYDDETGLHYNYYRTYDPSTGRYLESDPIGLLGGLNTYGYGYQNPSRYTDPTGEAVPLAYPVAVSAVRASLYLFRAYRAARAARAGQAAAAAAAASTIPGDTTDSDSVPLPLEAANDDNYCPDGQCYLVFAELLRTPVPAPGGATGIDLGVKCHYQCKTGRRGSIVISNTFLDVDLDFIEDPCPEFVPENSLSFY